MKLVYKKTIMEKMEEAILEAERVGKEIEMFILSRIEWDEFYDKYIIHSCSPVVYSPDSFSTYYLGIPVMVGL